MALTLEEETTLNEILSDINDATLIGWDRRFSEDIAQRYEDEGSDIFISPKMWKHLHRIRDAAIGV